MSFLVSDRHIKADGTMTTNRANIWYNLPHGYLLPFGETRTIIGEP